MNSKIDSLNTEEFHAGSDPDFDRDPLARRKHHRLTKERGTRHNDGDMKANYAPLSRKRSTDIFGPNPSARSGNARMFENVHPTGPSADAVKAANGYHARPLEQEREARQREWTDMKGWNVWHCAAFTSHPTPRNDTYYHPPITSQFSSQTNNTMGTNSENTQDDKTHDIPPTANITHRRVRFHPSTTTTKPEGRKSPVRFRRPGEQLSPVRRVRVRGRVSKPMIAAAEDKEMRECDCQGGGTKCDDEMGEKVEGEQERDSQRALLHRAVCKLNPFSEEALQAERAQRAAMKEEVNRAVKAREGRKMGLFR
ncbi:hypothetical protein BJ878DRAFT_545868 [Calycina marina]|uniref:Uncharacterized protein n=1 Tax=Calycina marina TaxID=1763456 RepID=A0A9P7YW73_9HELO|nr:hypothetical protein BJ878DRAFT_545868 [Calycina marina]